MLPAESQGPLFAALLALALSACSLPQRLGPPVASGADRVGQVEGARAGPVRITKSDAAAARDEDRALHLELIHGMLEQRQYYAAVAHVEAQRLQGGETPELGWLEAEARRRLGQHEAAEAGFKRLLKTAYGARAEHGLGLIAAADGDVRRARAHFAEAVRRAPTVAEFRNDLGFAELQMGRFDDALAAFATGAELAPDDIRIRSNLVLLLLTTGDFDRARSMAQDVAMPDATFDRLRQQAETLRRRLAAR
jgi:tetratricopeptide (TPR) repeat protein